MHLTVFQPSCLFPYTSNWSVGKSAFQFSNILRSTQFLLLTPFAFVGLSKSSRRRRRRRLFVILCEKAKNSLAKTFKP